MSAERDVDLDEKRVYEAKTGQNAVYLATGAGLARVSVSADMVGEFGLERRGETTDVAMSAGHLALATPEEVFVADGESFAPTGFGGADAVGFHDGALYAAGEGRVARLDDDGWATTAELRDIHAVSGGMIAAATGVHRLDGTQVGLSDARDVAVGRAVYAATGDGLYWLANGWRVAIETAVDVVACAADGRAHAAAAGTCYVRTDAADDWRPVELSVDGHVAAIGYGEDATYLATDDGTFLAEAGDGWRDRALGLRKACAMACP